MGEDRRFDEMRASLSKLAIFWTFQVVHPFMTIGYAIAPYLLFTLYIALLNFDTFNCQFIPPWC